MADTVQACRLLERARARDARFAYVLLAELDDADSCFARGYVVWHEDGAGRRSEGHYTSSRTDARAVFARRAHGAAARRFAWLGARRMARGWLSPG